MIRLHFKKQICMEGGYMLDNMEFMCGVVVLVVIIGFIWHTFFTDGDDLK